MLKEKAGSGGERQCGMGRMEIIIKKKEIIQNSFVMAYSMNKVEWSRNQTAKKLTQ